MAIKSNFNQAPIIHQPLNSYIRTCTDFSLINSRAIAPPQVPKFVAPKTKMFTRIKRPLEDPKLTRSREKKPALKSGCTFYSQRDYFLRYLRKSRDAQINGTRTCTFHLVVKDSFHWTVKSRLDLQRAFTFPAD